MHVHCTWKHIIASIVIHLGLPSSIPTNNMLMCIDRLQSEFGGVLASMKGIYKEIQCTCLKFCSVKCSLSLLPIHDTTLK